MVGALLDTNILIDYLGGIPEAKAELAHHTHPAISIITWMEVLVGATANEENLVRAWLSTFQCIGLDEAVAQRAVNLRVKRRVRLPDAIIWASAQINGLLLVTRNVKDFPPDDPGVRVPYVLGG